MKYFQYLFVFLASFTSTFLYADVSSHLDQIKKNPNALYAFFKQMPKGGELHYHLAGGAFPEAMLQLAMNDNYCVDLKTFGVSKEKPCTGLNSNELNNHPEVYNQIIRSWSLKDFVPGKESGHDHFFSGFFKFMPLVIDYKPQLLAEIIRTAAAQNELYLEVMDIPDNAKAISFGRLLNNQSFAEMTKILLADKAFQDNVQQTVQASEQLLQQTTKALGCEKTPQAKQCKIKVKLLYYVLREQPSNNMFAQTLNAFEAASRSKNALVGVNLVQPEDGMISLADYHQQMAVFEFFHRLYPKVHISLHAGELNNDLVAPKDLQHHIHDALFTGHAERIGHGVSIGYEQDVEKTLNYMATQHKPVEINLISNQKLLNVSGIQHPLNYYLAHKVPVVFSTDDEGMLRTDLTAQYVEAALNHGLDYKTLKQINRNALTYAFLPGKSLWENAEEGVVVKECKDLSSSSCLDYVKDHEKASLQWQLEKELSAFEQQF